MSFASVQFLVLFFVSIVILAFLDRFKSKYSQKFRHIYLLIASYIFYGWWDWRFCFLMLFEIIDSQVEEGLHGGSDALIAVMEQLDTVREFQAGDIQDRNLTSL